MRSRRAAWIPWIIAAVALAGCADELAPASDGGHDAVVAAPPSRYQAFADRIAADLEAHGVPGGALGIVEDGRLVFATGLGVNDRATGQPVGTGTVFRIASTTKPMTAVALMSLAEDGAVSLDAPITRYAPDLRLLAPNDPSRLTLRRLLSHTGGVPDVFAFECDEGPGALSAWFAAHPNLTLWSPPGRLWSYSNLGSSLAGLVGERASGLAFRDLIEARVLGPLGMTTATFDVDEVIAGGDYAQGHPTSFPFDTTLTRCGLSEPPGYLYASVLDMARFTEALLAWGGDVLSPLSLLHMALPQISTQAPPDYFYALGLMETRYRGRLLIGHPGDLSGTHSAWWMVPEERFGVIVLVNGDTYDPDIAAAAALDTFLELPPEPPTDWSTPPSDWWRYVGRYDGSVPAGAYPPGGVGEIDIALEGDQLISTTLEDGARFVLRQLARDTFVAELDGRPIVLTFWRDLLGRAEYIATRGGAARRIRPGARSSAAAPAPGGENPFARIAREHPEPLFSLTR